MVSDVSSYEEENKQDEAEWAEVTLPAFNEAAQLMLLAEECPICHIFGGLFVPYGDRIACVDCVAKENGETHE